jgi:hypothetical protein
MSRRTALLVAGAVGAVLLLAVLVGLSDLQDLRMRIWQVRWPWMLPAAVASLLSYACIGWCQCSILRLLGHHLPFATLAQAATVATVINRTLRSAGASGFAFLAWFASRFGVPPAPVLLSTLGFNLLTHVLLTATFTIGTLALAAAHLLGRAADRRLLLTYACVAAAYVASLAVMVVAIGSERLRTRWTAVLRRIAERVGRWLGRDAAAARAERFVDNLVAAGHEIARRFRQTAPAWGLALLRITLSVIALWLCLVAVSQPVSLPVLVLGYAAGKVVGVLSFIPTGLGLVEGSIVGVLAAFGVPYEAALLAALLNRAVYHVLPAIVAMLVFGPMLRSRTGSAA